jgi:hypothetical protein
VHQAPAQRRRDRPVARGAAELVDRTGKHAVQRRGFGLDAVGVAFTQRQRQRRSSSSVARCSASSSAAEFSMETVAFSRRPCRAVPGRWRSACRRWRRR